MKLFVTALSLLCFTAFFGQNLNLTGQIIDANGNPLKGVNVYIKSEKTGTQTNAQGLFTITRLDPKMYELEVSYLGFQSKVILADMTEGRNLNLNTVTLLEGNEILNEVVIDTDRINKFSRKRTAYVSKLPLKDIENPQVYSTVTNALLESQVVTSFEDALKNAVGLEKLWTSTGRGGDGAGFYALRGFSVQPQLVNGLPGITNGTINPANIERIEVIKGPSATLFGNAVTSYGGLINVVTKKPYIGTGGEVSFTTGSYGLNQINLDVNTEVADDMYFRLNSSYFTEQSFQDAGFRKNFFVAPSLSYRVNDRLSFSFYGEITQAEQTNPMFLFLNRSAPQNSSNLDELGYNTKLSFTSNDLSLSNPTQNYRVEMDYKLSNNWRSQSLVSRSSTSTDGYYSYLFDFGILEGDTFTRFISDQSANTVTTDVQQNFTGNFELLNMRHRMVVGLDYFTSTESSQNTGFAFYGNVQPDGTVVNDDPFTTEVETDPFPLSSAGVDQALASQAVGNNKSQFEIYSMYVSDVIDITDRLSAMLGLRLDHFNNSGDVLNPDDDYEQTEFSPKAGLIFQPIKDQLSVFANYQNSFTNVAPQLVGNPENGPQTLQTFDPEQANQYEFGVKANLLGDRLNVILNYYDITVEDRVITDPDSPFNRIQGGEVVSRGFEAEVNANPINGLNIRGGFSFNDSETTQSDNLDILNRRPLEAGPETVYNFWSTYQFQNGGLKGFGLGAGFNGASERFAINYASTGEFILPSYTIANASLFYESKSYRVSLKLNNAFNETYFKGWTTITPQMPRQLLANFTYRF
jgi:iron complex outermembrane receptor protein